MQLSEYPCERLRDDGEFILYRGRAKHPGATFRSAADPGFNSAQPRDTQEDRPRILIEERTGLGLGGAAPGPFRAERAARRSYLKILAAKLSMDFLSGPMEMTQFLSVAVGLATALGGLHERELIHKDVKPTNVLVDSATGQVRLIGFGIASRLRREHQPPEPPEFIAGTLPYMAPEQTGRMNRSIDSRSDLYALGVTLYEMLTGNRPFTASDPLEWVHCHIARHPVPPHERVEECAGLCLCDRDETARQDSRGTLPDCVRRGE